MSLTANGLILNGLRLWSERDHIINTSPTIEYKRMASGRLVGDMKWRKIKIECDFDYLPDGMLKQLYSILNAPDIEATYYTPESNDRATGHFICTSYPVPKVRDWDTGVSPPRPMWSDITFTLEEK